MAMNNDMYCKLKNGVAVVLAGTMAMPGFGVAPLAYADESAPTEGTVDTSAIAAETAAASASNTTTSNEAAATTTPAAPAKNEASSAVEAAASQPLSIPSDLTDVAAVTDWTYDALEASYANDAQAAAYTTDIADAWAQGSVTLSKTGLYTLSHDVTTSSALVVNAPDDGLIVIDLNGHSVDVKGSASLEAALDIAGSKGTVVLVDSAAHVKELDAEKRGGAVAQRYQEDKKTPEATITLTTAAASAAVIDIAADAPVPASKAGDPVAPALVVADVALEVDGASTSSARTVSATAINTQSKNVVLAGGLSTTYKNVASSTDLVTTKKDAFVVEEGFATDEALTAEVAGEIAGTALGHGDLDAVRRAANEAHASESARVDAANAKFSEIEIDAKSGAYVYRDGSFVYDPAATTSGKTATGTSTLSDDPAEGIDLSTLADSLNANGQLVISEAGTYNLTSDLELSAAIVIDIDAYASERDVTINLNGHTLSVYEAKNKSNSSEGSAIRALNAGSVTINGGGGHIIFKGMTMQRVVYAETVRAFTMNDVSVAATSRDDYRMISGTKAIAIQVQRGTVSLTNVSACIDLSNQGYAGGSTSGATPTGVSLGESVSSATLKNCTIEALHSSTASAADFADPSSAGWARGIESTTTSLVTIDGCKISAWSPLGGAVGVLGKNVKLTGEATAIDARASRFSVGVYAESTTKSIVLDAPLEVNHLGLASSTTTVGLFEAVTNRFSFGSGFSADSLSVRSGTDSYTSNVADTVFASFEAGVSLTEQQVIVSALKDAIRDEADGKLVAENNAVVFKSYVAPASVTHEGVVTEYSSVDDAVKALKNGDTLTLNKDAGSIKLGKTTTKGMFGAAGETYTIDLNGHSMVSLECNARADVVIQSTGERGKICNTEGEGALIQHGTGTLTCKNVDITSAPTSGNSYALSITRESNAADGSGPVVLEDVNIVAVAADMAVCAINQTSGAGGNISITGGSIAVSAGSKGATTTGIKSTASGATISIKDCPISVAGNLDATHGIDTKGIVEVWGTSGECDLSVTVAPGSTANVAGMYAAGDKSQFRLFNFATSVSSDDENAQDLWCLTGDSTVTPSKAVLVLDGSCGFASSTNTHVDASGSLGLEAPLSVGAAFNLNKSDVLGDAGAGKLIVRSANLAAGALATYAGSDVAVTNLFEASSDSIFAGCSLVQKDGLLVWNQVAALRNDRTGVVHLTLSSAIAAAEEGDTITLVGDSSIYEAVVANKAISLDLAGHTLSIHGQKNGSVLTCDGATMTVLDSSEGNLGELALYVGGKETAAATYDGVLVDNGGAFLVDDACVRVSFEGSCSYQDQPLITLNGVDVKDGSAELKGSSSLTVVSCLDPSGFGAVGSNGVYAGEKCTSIALSAASALTVDNTTHKNANGTLVYPDAENPMSSTYSSSVANLLEIHPAKDSELYQLVQSAFRVYAEYDSDSDSDGKEYGTNVYYASGLLLENGLRVWAYSDPVDPADAGQADTVVATHIFVYVPYDNPIESYGIAAASDFAGTVSVDGTVTATSEAAGYAFALYENGEDATWSAANATLSASVDEDMFTRIVGNFDLKDYTDLSSFSDVIVYPKARNAFKSLTKSKSYSAPIGTAGEDYVEDVRYWDDNASDYDFLFAPEDSTVEVSLTNLHDASGAAMAKQTVEVEYGTTLAASGASLPTPSDYTVGDVTYRFVGWKIQGISLEGNYCYRTEYLQNELVFKQSVVNSAANGAASLTAVYVPVSAGQHLVSFFVDYAVAAAAFNDGDAPTFGAALGNENKGAPEKLVTYGGYSYPFAGWSTDTANTDGSAAEGEELITGLLPAVTQDASYVAKFDPVLTKVNVSFICHTTIDGKTTWGVATLRDHDWTESAIEAALADPDCDIPAVGESRIINNTTYTCLGWSTRASDKEPVYTDTIPFVSSTARFESTGSVYEVYRVESATATVTFCNTDGSVYQTLSDVPYTATLASILPEAPTREGYTFKGWNTKSDATLAFGETTSTVRTMVGTDGAVTLYPVWRENSSTQETKCTVRFLDTDGTLLDIYDSIIPGTTFWANEHDEPIGPTGLKKDLFECWVDEAGNVFNTKETKIWASMDIYVKYRDVVDNSVSPGGINAGSLLNRGSIASTGLTNSALSSGGGLSTGGVSAENATSKQSSTESGVNSANYDAESRGLADESGKEHNQTTGVIGGIALVLLLAVALIALFRWFLGRHKGEDDAEEELEAELNSSESIRF